MAWRPIGESTDRVLEVGSLTVEYRSRRGRPSVRVVDDVSFSVTPGRTGRPVPRSGLG